MSESDVKTYVVNLLIIQYIYIFTPCFYKTYHIWSLNNQILIYC